MVPEPEASSLPKNLAQNASSQASLQAYKYIFGVGLSNLFSQAFQLILIVTKLTIMLKENPVMSHASKKIMNYVIFK